MFHPVQIRHNGQHVGYEIWFSEKRTYINWRGGPVVTLDDKVNLKRHEAYALARAWNT